MSVASYQENLYHIAYYSETPKRFHWPKRVYHKLNVCDVLNLWNKVLHLILCLIYWRTTNSAFSVFVSLRPSTHPVKNKEKENKMLLVFPEPVLGHFSLASAIAIILKEELPPLSVVALWYWFRCFFLGCLAFFTGQNRFPFLLYFLPLGTGVAW